MSLSKVVVLALRRDKLASVIHPLVHFSEAKTGALTLYRITQGEMAHILKNIAFPIGLGE